MILSISRLIVKPNFVLFTKFQIFPPIFLGVDWKSLTIPASLPITTDYFPDPVSLVNDYVVNEYDLIPEEILSDAAADRSPLDAKSALPTNEEIFTELISQRLAQGFQLILLTPQVSFNLYSTEITKTLHPFAKI